MPAKMRIRGDLILPERVVANAILCWENGRIVAIEDVAKSHQAEVIDASEFYVAPGFVDIHVHGAAGADYMDGTRQAVQTINKAHARHGVTSFAASVGGRAASRCSSQLGNCPSWKCLANHSKTRY